MLGCVLALVVSHSGPVSADPATPAFVALGDSYPSGVGTRLYLADGTSCQRSLLAYPSFIAAGLDYSLSFRACSGAKVADVRRAQLGALSPATDYVSLSVGGNDAGFADVLTTCAQPAWLSDCGGAVDRAQDYVRDVLPDDLTELSTEVQALAPAARVTIVGYPRIFNGTDCNALTWFSGWEMSRLNETADLLNEQLREVAAATGVRFADPTRRFDGHAVCDDREWVNGLSLPISESYHPNRAGHRRGYTPRVSKVLTGTRLVVTRAVRTKALEGAHILAQDQRQYAALDRSITPERFVAPDLTTPRARRVAARLGIDLDDPASIARADRRFSRAQAQAQARAQAREQDQAQAGRATG